MKSSVNIEYWSDKINNFINNDNIVTVKKYLNKLKLNNLK